MLYRLPDRLQCLDAKIRAVLTAVGLAHRNRIIYMEDGYLVNRADVTAIRQ